MKECKPCGDEALRILALMPAWKPEIRDGRPIVSRGKMTVPFEFLK